LVATTTLDATAYGR